MKSTTALLKGVFKLMFPRNQETRTEPYVMAREEEQIVHWLYEYKKGRWDRNG